MHAPGSAAVAILFQSIGWLCQLLAVYTAMRAFGIHESLPSAGLVLLLMNVATVFPLWPGNIGLLQAAIALPLRQYGVPAGQAIAFGLGAVLGLVILLVRRNVPESPMRPVSNTEFRVDAAGFRVVFHPENGKVDRLTMHRGARELHGTRISK